MGIIYMISNNINNKKYIGKTSRSLEDRWKEHIRKYNNPNSGSYNYTIYKAFRKYGIQNFECKQIEECPNNIINEREQYWINYYNSYLDGYNMTEGGEGHLKYADEELLSLWNKGFSLTEISKIIGINLGYLSTRFNKMGITHSEILERTKTKLLEINTHPILQFDLQGNFIKEWATSKQAAIGINKPNGDSNIRSCCRGKIKTAYGFIWKRKELINQKER